MSKQSSILQIIQEFEQFLEQYATMKSAVAWCNLFHSKFDKLKAINVNELSTYSEHMRKIIMTLIVRINPINNNYNTKNINNDDNDNKEQKNDQPNINNIKLTMLQWIIKSSLVSIISMEDVVKIVAHCIEKENGNLAIITFNNILIPRLVPLRQDFNDFKSNYLTHNDKKKFNVTPKSPGEYFFRYVINKNNLSNVKALILIINTIKQATKDLKEPIDWLLKVYNVKVGNENGTAYYDHEFISVLLKHLTFIFWIIEIVNDINKYLNEISLRIVNNSQHINCNFANNLIDLCCDESFNVVYNYLNAIIEIYIIDDGHLNSYSNNKIMFGSSLSSIINNIRIHWLSMLISGLCCIYKQYIETVCICNNYDEDLRQFKKWEKKQIGKLVKVMFTKHIENMRNKCNVDCYCLYLETIATNCCQSVSFTAIISKFHFKEINNPQFFTGINYINENNHDPAISYDILCFNDSIIMKHNIKYWYYCILCSFWINVYPVNVKSIEKLIREDFQYYIQCETNECQIFNFDLIKKSVAILTSIIRNQENSSSIQQHSTQALKGLIIFVESFLSQYGNMNLYDTLENVWSVFDTLKWVLENKLNDIDKDLDEYFKLLHVKQYKIYLKIKKESISSLTSSNNNNNMKKRVFCEMDNNDNCTEANMKKKRKSNDGVVINSNIENFAAYNDDDDVNMMLSDDDDIKTILNDDDDYSSSVQQQFSFNNNNEKYSRLRPSPLQQTSSQIPLIPTKEEVIDYIASKSEITTGNGCINLDSSEITDSFDVNKNSSLLISKIEYLLQAIFSCIRYCRSFESKLKSNYISNENTIDCMHFHILTDINLQRYSKQFSTYLKLLRIFCLPQEILPHLNFKTRNEIIEKQLISFTLQLSESQIRYIWAENIELIINLAEAFPYSNVYINVLNNCCSIVSKPFPNLKNIPNSNKIKNYRSIVRKSFIVSDVYLAYLVKNLDKLLGDDKNENISLNEFYNDLNIKNYQSIQFIERHFFNSIKAKNYFKKYLNNKTGYGFIIHYDSNLCKHIKIPTFNGFILPPIIEEEKFTLFAKKYLQFKELHNNNDIENNNNIINIVSYLDFKSINVIKKENDNKSQFLSTRWVELKRHQWIIKATDIVIESLFKLFIHISEQKSIRKRLDSLYFEAKQIITFYMKELIYKCITYSFETSHCVLYINLLQQIMTRCIKNNIVSLLVPYTNFIIPCLVCLSNRNSSKFNNFLNNKQFIKNNSKYRILSSIPYEFELNLCKSGECLLILPTHLSLQCLPFIKQLIKPILNGLKLENTLRYPNFTHKSLNVLNKWFDDLTIPSIESLLNEFGDQLSRALCKIIQKCTNTQFKSLAIQALGKLGGNNRRFLQKSSSMHYEKCVLTSTSLDFKMLQDQKPKVIEISFNNIVDNALNLIIKQAQSSSSSFVNKNNINNYHKTNYAMKTIKSLIITLIWNENDFKNINEKSMKNLCNNLMNNKKNIIETSDENISCLDKELQQFECLNLVINHNINKQTQEQKINSNHDCNNNDNDINNNNSIINKFKEKKIDTLSHEKLKTAIMCIIIACADNNLSEYRSFLKSLSIHFGLLYCTKSIKEIYFEYDDDQSDYIPLNSKKDLIYCLNNDIYLDAIITILMSQNITWKYSANIALIQFLDVVDIFCFNSCQHQKLLNSNNVNNNDLKIKKYSIIIKHILKQLQYHVMNNTNAVLDGIIMGLTTISFQIQNKIDILTFDLIEQFLMICIQTARYTFIKQNDEQRHYFLYQLSKKFLDEIWKILPHKIEMFRKLKCIVTKMHLVPIGSRELMYKILNEIKSYLKCDFSNFIPIEQFNDSIFNNYNYNNYSNLFSQKHDNEKTPLVLCGIFESASWLLSQKLLIINKEDTNEQQCTFLTLAIKHLLHYINDIDTTSSTLSSSSSSTLLASQPLTSTCIFRITTQQPQNTNQNDPIITKMNKFLEFIEDYSSNIQLKKIIAIIKFIGNILCTSFWKNISMDNEIDQKQHELMSDVDKETFSHSKLKYKCINLLLELLHNDNKIIHDAAYLSFDNLKKFGYKLQDLNLMKSSLLSTCIKCIENLSVNQDPQKIIVIVSLYKIFTSEMITKSIYVKITNYFSKWLKHVDNINNNQFTSMYNYQLYSNVKIGITLASFLKYNFEFELYLNNNHNEVYGSDEKISDEDTYVNDIIDLTLNTIYRNKMLSIWSFISCFLNNSYNSLYPLHMVLISFYDKSPSRLMMNIFNNVQSLETQSNKKKKITFYKQQIFLSILPLCNSEDIKSYFKDYNNLQNFIKKFDQLSIEGKNCLMKILVYIGEKDRGWINKLQNIELNILNNILNAYTKQLNRLKYEDLNFYSPEILQFPNNVIKCFIYGYDKYIDAKTLAILSTCFVKVSFVNYHFFYKFLHNYIPQNTSIPRRQTLILNLLMIVFKKIENKKEKNNILTLSILKYAINGICSSDGIINKKETIWTYNQNELSIYLITHTLQNLQILSYPESIRAEFIKLIYNFVKHSEILWIRDQIAIWRVMWNIYKNNKKIGSRLYSAKVILKILIFYDNEQKLQLFDNLLFSLLRESKIDCNKYAILLQSIFQNYIQFQIKQYNKKSNAIHDNKTLNTFGLWLNKFLDNILQLQDLYILQIFLNTLLINEHKFAQYCDSIYLLHYKMLNNFVYKDNTDNKPQQAFITKIAILESICRLSLSMNKYVGINNKDENLNTSNQKLSETFEHAWSFIGDCIVLPQQSILTSSLIFQHSNFLLEQHLHSFIIHYATQTAKNLIKISNSNNAKQTYVVYYKNQQEHNWQYQWDVLNKQLRNHMLFQNDPSILYKIYYQYAKLLALLRIINQILKVNESNNFSSVFITFTKYKYFEIIHLWTSILTSVPFNKQKWNKLPYLEQARFYFNKYWTFDCDNDNNNNNVNSGKINDKLQKITKIQLFMNCDDIYFEEMINFNIQVSKLLQYIMKNNFKNISNNNSEQFYKALQEIKIYDTYISKIHSNLNHALNAYKKCMNKNININHIKNMKYCNIAIVMNCQVFRFWEPILKSSIIGKTETKKILTYLTVFIKVIFNDYKLRIQKLADIMSCNLKEGIFFDICKTWQNHIKVFSIPLLKSIAKIICVNCKKYLSECFNVTTITKSQNESQLLFSSNNLYHHGKVNHKTFYEHFIEIFCKLFSMQFKSMNLLIDIHNNLIFDIAQMIKNNLIKSNICDFLPNHKTVHLKLQLIESMRCVFVKYPKLSNIYVDCVSYILHDIQNNKINCIPQPFYMINNNDTSDMDYDIEDDNKNGDDNKISTYFVTSFLTCLTLPNNINRSLFHNYMKNSIKDSFFDRLQLIYGGADWIEIGDKYWLTPGLDLLFDLFDYQSNIDVHNHQTDFSFVKHMKSYDITNNSVSVSRLIDITKIIDCNNNITLKNLIVSEQKFLENSFEFKSHEILKPLIEWMYLSPKIAENLYLQIIPQITKELSEQNHTILLNNFCTMLLIENDISFEAYHCFEDDEHECCDPLKSIMKGIALNSLSPFPDSCWDIITRCANYHSCWFECLDVINKHLNKILPFPEYTVKYKHKQDCNIIDSKPFQTAADIFDNLYKKIGENDICTSFWKIRTKHPGTLYALNLKQFDRWEHVQHQLWKCQQQTQTKCKTVSETEFIFWHKEWLLSCKKLNHWTILNEIMNDDTLPELQLEVQCQTRKWYEFNELLQLHDETKDDPDHCTFKSYLYLLYSYLSQLIILNTNQQNNNIDNNFNYNINNVNNNIYINKSYGALLHNSIYTDFINNIIKNDMPRILSRSFQKFPSFISSIHSNLLHFLHLFVEIEEGIKCLELTRQTSQFILNKETECLKNKCNEEIIKIQNRWRQRLPNVYESLESWSEIFAFRQNCFQFNSYLQKHLDKNSLTFNDEIWTTIRLSKHARHLNFYNSSLLILSEIMDIKIENSTNFYLRIKEQVAIAKINIKDQYNLNNNKNNNNKLNNNQNSNECLLNRALDIIKMVNLKYFTELEKSELFSMKAEIQQELNLLDASNASYSASLAIAGDNWRAWRKWGDFCDRIYLKTKDYRWAMYAMISYLCSLHGGDELTRAYWSCDLKSPISSNYSQQNQKNTHNASKKYSNPETDLQYSNYHHLVIPRILMLIQAANLNAKHKNVQEKDANYTNLIGNKSNTDLNNNDDLKEYNKNENDNIINNISISQYINEKPLCNARLTKDNSPFIKSFYDGVFTLPPHVFLDYIPQLISGLYRYEQDACFLILNDHIRFIAPQYLFYYVYHYKKNNETKILHELINECDKHNKKSKNQIKKRIQFLSDIVDKLKQQTSYKMMCKIDNNLRSNNISYKLNSIINEQSDLMSRFEKFGHDVCGNNLNEKQPTLLLPYIQLFKLMLFQILQQQPNYQIVKSQNSTYNQNVIITSELDFTCFINNIHDYIHQINKMFINDLESMKQKHYKNKYNFFPKYAKKFERDFKFVIDIHNEVAKHSNTIIRKNENQHNNLNVLIKQIKDKQKLFETVYTWYKDLIFKVNKIQSSILALEFLYNSDLNFYEPYEQINCPGYINATLCNKKLRINNLPDIISNNDNKNNNFKSNNTDKDYNNLRQSLLNNNINAPNIIRIQPKLILLPNILKEFYILCNDGNVRSYRYSLKLITNSKSKQLKSSLKLIRDQQLIKFCNELFKSEVKTKKRFLCNNHISNVIPCNRDSIFYEFNCNEVSLNEIVNTSCDRFHLSQIEALSTYFNKLQYLQLSLLKNSISSSIDENTKVDYDKQTINVFETIQKDYLPQTIFDNYVNKSLIGSSFKFHYTSAEFFQFKKRFAKSLAFHNLWLNCWRTKNRNLSSYFVRMDTGELIVRGEHGTNLHSFNINQENFSSIANKFPLRITPNFKYILLPNLLDAHLTLSLAAMVTVIIKSSDDNSNDKIKQDGRYLKHFMYIHFRETKLEQYKKQLISTERKNFCYNDETKQYLIYNLLDKNLLNQEFKWIDDLNHLSNQVINRMNMLVTGIYNNNNNNNNTKYVQSIETIGNVIRFASSINTTSKMPANWTPFF